MRSKRNQAAGALALLLLGPGCGESDPRSVPWSNQRTQIIDMDRNVTDVRAAAGDDCIDYASACLKPQEKCGKAGTDIVLDSSGRLLDFICYPGDKTLSVDEIEAQRGDIAQNQNNSVVLLDNVDDGADIEGNLSIDANNVVIYGESADTAVISGSVTVDGNNALIRGVRIQGDVTIAKNDVVMALCVIEGDLIVNGNGAEIVACHVLGAVRVAGNNARLLGNRIGGAVSVSGNGASCVDNFAASDANGGRVIDMSELGAPLACP